jgi:hypothetical protein
MTTTQTFSSTATFTVTHAKYLVSKIAADLRQMQLFYGSPSDLWIERYVTEAVVLLLGGYLKCVTYGFRRNGQWVVALKYDAHVGGALLNDDRAGRVKPGVNVLGASWGSFLEHSTKFLTLSGADRERVEAFLPFERGHGEEPRVGGSWMADRSYSNGGVSLQRQMYSQN